MRFISAITRIRRDSVERVRYKMKNDAALVMNPDTVDQVDFYTVRMRVHISGRGAGFYIEVPTDLVLKETGNGMQLIAYSNLAKALILSAGTAVTVAAVLLVVYNFASSLLSLVIVFPITCTALVMTIKRRASQLLRYFSGN